MDHEQLNEKISAKIEEELREVKEDIKEIKRLVKVLEPAKSQFFLEGVDPHEIKDTIETVKAMKKSFYAVFVSTIALWIKALFL